MTLDYEHMIKHNGLIMTTHQAGIKALAITVTYYWPQHYRSLYILSVSSSLVLHCWFKLLQYYCCRWFDALSRYIAT